MQLHQNFALLHYPSSREGHKPLCASHLTLRGVPTQAAVAAANCIASISLNVEHGKRQSRIGHHEAAFSREHLSAKPREFINPSTHHRNQARINAITTKSIQGNFSSTPFVTRNCQWMHE